MSRMKLHVTGGTEAKNPDSDRENQDAIYFSLQEEDSAALLIVADGVGGHHDGGLASRTVVETMSRELADIFIAVPIDETSALEFLQDQLRFAVYRTHETISAYAHKKGQRVASTITCALIYNEKAIIANVGDSRTYLGQQYQLEQVTKDHSLVAWLVREKQLDPSEASNHPYRNVIMHALGTPDPPQIDVFVRDLAEQEYLILCSDGIWDSISSAEIVSYLETSASLDAAKDEIMRAAQDHRDDISIVIARLVWETE